jgi:DNA-binding response OmpR family regulator
MSSFPTVVPEAGARTNPFPPVWSGDAVLLIDDDPFISDILERILSHCGRRVWRAGDGREGAELFAAHRDEIALVMLDCGLPDINGVSLCRTLRHQAADLPIILTSGFEVDGAAGLANGGPTVFLAKPFFAAQIEELVCELAGAVT